MAVYLSLDRLCCPSTGFTATGFFISISAITNGPSPLGPRAPSALPVVTVQLPVFNERYVVERLIDAVCRLDYPREKLEIQVLDDSTDDTAATSFAPRSSGCKTQGFLIEQIHRKDRTGFKAGALASGSAHSARGISSHL